MMISRAVRVAGPVGLTAMLLSLSACGGGNPLDALGARIPPPDEFQVVASAPLVMPTSGTLPVPRPGAPSPLTPDPLGDAERALLGTSADTTVATAPSSGERALLSSANAAAASSEIRVQLEEDKTKEAAKKPYEAPSLAELLGGKKTEKLDEKELLDPVAESQRLQREGQLTPVDPNAENVSEDAVVEPPRAEYPTGRPESPIKADGTAPAY
jgi:DUF3035 family protein